MFKKVSKNKVRKKRFSFKRKTKNGATTLHPGDRRPAEDISKNKMFYEKKLSKYKGQMRWLVIERPSGSIILITHFEDKAKELTDFHNKNKQWIPQGGIPNFLTLGKI